MARDAVDALIPEGFLPDPARQIADVEAPPCDHVEAGVVPERALDVARGSVKGVPGGAGEVVGVDRRSVARGDPEPVLVD